MKVFEEYSQYYNLLYKEKDYEGEAGYVADLLKQFAPKAEYLLDIGCGTGKHANLLTRKGYKVDGLDMSEGMLQTAKKNFPGMNFYQGNACDFDLKKKYDAIISLFHVASYQTTNDQIVNYFKSVKKHLKEGGLFIFDFWYGPAVLEDKPAVRVKRLEDDTIKVTRIAEPSIHQNENIVDVNYEVIIEEKATGNMNRISETHKMRYYFLPELKLLFEINDFKFLECYEWMSRKKPDVKSWNALCILKN